MPSRSKSPSEVSSLLEGEVPPEETAEERRRRIALESYHRNKNKESTIRRKEAYIAKNRERLKAYRKKYYAEKRERLLKKTQEYRKMKDGSKADQ